MIKLWDQFKNTINKWAEQVQNLWEKKYFGRAALMFLGPPILIGLISVLLIEVFVNVSMFLRLHYAQLVCAALLLWGFVEWLDKHKEKRLEYRRREREEEEREEYLAQQEYTMSKDATYVEQGKIMYDVTREASGLGIVPPVRLSDLYSPCRTIPKMNGAFFLCQYLLQKNRAEIDTDRIKEVLQTKINQRLMIGDYPGIAAKYVYRGRVYSGMMVDKVIDGRDGGFVEVYTVLVNNAYCRWKQQQDLNRDIPAPSVNRQDIDY